jgi:hypothetical protein
MKNKRFFTDSNFTMLSFVLAMCCLMMLFACQKDEASSIQLLETPVVHTDAGSDGKLIFRLPTTCECEYQIVSVSSSSMNYYLTGDVLCNDSCFIMSAYRDSCLSHTSCDDYIPSSYPSNYRLFNCTATGNSSINVDLQPYSGSDCATPISGSIQFRVKCVQKPSGGCGLGTYYTSNTKTLTYTLGGTNLPAIVSLGGCGCEPTIY